MNDASCSGMCNAQQFYRAMLMDLSGTAVPGVRNPNFRGWGREVNLVGDGSSARSGTRRLARFWLSECWELGADGCW